MTSLRPLTRSEKDLLTEKVLNVHLAEPGRLRRTLPEIADLLDGLEGPIGRQSDGSGLVGLTARERKFHQDELDKLLGRYSTLTVADAIKALEHGANLLAENNSTPKHALREGLLKLVRKATGIRPRKKGESVEKVVEEGSPSRVVPVVRGVDLHLTWEFKLVKVTLDPEQWRLRCQAVSIVGIGSDFTGAVDVAENHDEYFVEATENA